MAGMRRLLGVLAMVAPAVALAGTAAPRDVAVVNHAPRTINELYISPETSNEWGMDRLGDGTIAPNRSQRVSLGDGDACHFDIQVVYDDASREERHDVDLCHTPQVVFDGSRAELPKGIAGGAHPVVIVNESSRPIQQVLISPADSGDWGDDLLGRDSLSVGDRVTLTYHGVCLADLRIVYDNRSAEERRDLDVCALHGVVVQPGWTTADLLAPLPAPRADAGSHQAASQSAQRAP